MIGLLRGTVAVLDDDTLVIDVQGVGYEVFALPRLLHSLKVGDEATVSIETVVREDFIKLYGFESANERACFRLLQTVQGVGAKHALAILHVLGPAELFDAIAMKDATALARAHGVGARIAQRIVAELENKVGALAVAGTPNPFAKAAGKARASDGGAADVPDISPMGARADAVSALANLGYDGSAARRAVAMVSENAGGEAGDVESLIKAALKELAAA